MPIGFLASPVFPNTQGTRSILKFAARTPPASEAFPYPRSQYQDHQRKLSPAIPHLPCSLPVSAGCCISHPMDVKVDVRGSGYPPTPGQPWLAAGPIYRQHRGRRASVEDSGGEWAEMVKITACPAERKEVRLVSPSEHTSHGQGGHGGDGSQRRSGG